MLKYKTAVNCVHEYNIDGVYGHYKNDLSKIIAYIEVYEHDLPVAVIAQIADFFQTIALYETEVQNDTQISNVLYREQLKITQSFYKYAICMFIKNIQAYKKMFKKYKYRGVMKDGSQGQVPFVDYADKEEKKIINELSEKMKICYRHAFQN